MKVYGADPNNNSRLAAILATAKKAGFPKASMEAAVARGQGRSATGAALENLTLEVILPPGIGIVVDIETDNKAATLPDLRHLIKVKGGTVTPTAYLFQRKGRVAFEKDERNLGEDEVLEQAIEAGAEDVETDEDGNIVVWTDPSMISAMANSLQQGLDLKVLSSDIIWDANKDTNLALNDDTEAKSLQELVNVLRENSNVQAIYTNATQGNVSDEVWAEVDVD
ncbi:hypothetical protein BP6252_01168 [Coleophoma cylindrospora]|uniref:YebC-like protein n=1 Tax=Coleophoma cylindrospora TaxID=1849047 RepID=A0A3D8SS45_9HELO|nr:hypothetical protein BP6252_01168 [Coleophoma cylindrospora]